MVIKKECLVVDCEIYHVLLLSNCVVTMVALYYRMCSIMKLVFWLVQELE